MIASNLYHCEIKYNISKTILRKDLYCKCDFDFFTEIIKNKVIMNGCVYFLQDLLNLLYILILANFAPRYVDITTLCLIYIKLTL